MPLTLSRSELLRRLYFDRAYIEAARAISYGGVTMTDFWEKTKALGIPNGKMLEAVYDITRGDKREEKPARYELLEDVRRMCWQLLGPSPEQEDAFWRHPDGSPMERPKAEEADQTLAEKVKKPKKARGR